MRKARGTRGVKALTGGRGIQGMLVAGVVFRRPRVETEK